MNVTTITPDETCKEITIEGCNTLEEAHTAAIEWCDENNCILVDIKQEGGQFVAAVTSDDYH